MEIDGSANADNSGLLPTTGKEYYIYAYFTGTATFRYLILPWDLVDFDPNTNGWAKLTNIVVAQVGFTMVAVK